MSSFENYVFKKEQGMDYLKKRRIEEQFKCMDNCVDFGRKISKAFMQPKDAQNTVEYIDYRNQDAGRMVRNILNV